MSTTNKLTDSDYLVFARNYLTVAEAKQQEIGLSDGDIAELRNLVQSFADKLAMSNALKIRSSAAVVEKDDKRTALSGKVRRLSNKISGEEGVPDATRTELGLFVQGAARTALSPNTPYDLVANLLTVGSVEIYWNRAQNSERTLYVLEMQTERTDAAWVTLDILHPVKFLHKNPPDANRISYRVRARRRNELSAPSNTATVELRKTIVS
jgi:hypothetical protein